MHQGKRCCATSHAAHCCQLAFLLVGHNGQVPHLVVGLGYHALRHGPDAQCQRLSQLGSVESVVVLHHHASVLNFDVDFKLGHIQFEQFLADGLAGDGVAAQHPHLVGVAGLKPKSAAMRAKG